MALANEARPKDDVSAVLQDWLDEPGILRGIVFQVGVLNNHDIARDVTESFPEGRSLPLIARLVEDPNIVGLGLDLRENLSRSIRAPVINEDDLLGNGHILNPANDFADPLLFVVNRHDNGEREALGDRADSELPADTLAEKVMQNVVSIIGREIVDESN